MQTKVFWVPGPWPGKLGIVPRPRGGDWLESEIRAWREAAIDVVVSLLEPEEEAQLALEGETGGAAASGIDFRSLPIPDRGVPKSMESCAALVHELVVRLNSGKNVAVHCRQGIGRSGLVVAAVLLSAGKELADVLKIVGESRGLEIPETAEQRRWLDDFARWLTKGVAD